MKGHLQKTYSALTRSSLFIRVSNKFSSKTSVYYLKYKPCGEGGGGRVRLGGDVCVCVVVVGVGGYH